MRHTQGGIPHVGALCEEGFSGPWIIAMDEKPSKGKVLDYGMRRGIEALFSDMKTRGFGITKTQLKDSSRIERLMLVLSVASYWAVSTGMRPKPPRSKKRGKEPCLILQTRTKVHPGCYHLPKENRAVVEIFEFCQVLRSPA